MNNAEGPRVQVLSLVQGYGRRLVFDGIDLALGPGITALVGPNGAGKSTLLATIATVLPPKGGELRITGTTVRSRRSVRAARAQMGYLPQGFGADPDFTVRDFVCYVGWLRELPRKEISAAAARAIDAVELTDRAGSRFRSLSGGLRQRAGIAAAIVGEPSIIILDEPTVGLDPAQRLGFRALLRSLAGSAVVLSTHLIEDVSAVADRIVLLDEGEFRFDGTVAELRRHATGAGHASDLESGYIAMLRGDR